MTKKFSIPEREIATPVTERRFEIWETYYDRVNRNRKPNYTALVYYFNGRRVAIAEGVVLADKYTYDLVYIDEHCVVAEAWDSPAGWERYEQDRYPASEVFQMITGWYPFEFRAICEMLERRGFRPTRTVVEQTTWTEVANRCATPSRP